MPRTDEGEFELVLGNRQLLSVFFIVVVLLGVFFVMGYILGKNASPASVVDVASARKTDLPPAAEPLVVDKTVDKPSAAPPALVTKEPVREPVKEPVAAKEPVRETVKEVSKPTPTPPPPPKTEPKSESVAAGTPGKGTLYLQVAAVGKPEGEVVSKVLRSKGYKVMIAEVGDGKTYRVLVGPLDQAELGKTRGELTTLGFSPFPRKF
jgi:cell division protein FtsN